MDNDNMNEKMFYSEDDLKNIVSKNMMDSVEICPIRKFDTDILVRVGHGAFEKKSLECFAKTAFLNRNVVAVESSDYGIFVTFG